MLIVHIHGQRLTARSLDELSSFLKGPFADGAKSLGFCTGSCSAVLLHKSSRSNSIPQAPTAFQDGLKSACMNSNTDRADNAVTAKLQVLEILLVSRTTKASRGCCQGPNAFETRTLSTAEGSESFNSSKGACFSSNQRADAASQIETLVAEPCRNVLN